MLAITSFSVRRTRARPPPIARGALVRGSRASGKRAGRNGERACVGTQGSD